MDDSSSRPRLRALQALLCALMSVGVLACAAGGFLLHRYQPGRHTCESALGSLARIFSRSVRTKCHDADLLVRGGHGLIVAGAACLVIGGGLLVYTWQTRRDRTSHVPVVVDGGEAASPSTN